MCQKYYIKPFKDIADKKTPPHTHDFLTCKSSNTQSLPKFYMKIMFCSWEDLSLLFKEGLQEICISSRHYRTMYQWLIMRF